MPLYEYQCKNCGFKFDEIRKIEDRKKPTESYCPKCNEKKIELKIGECGILFGFHGSTIQSKAPDEFKSILKNVKKNYGGKGGELTKGIEL